MNILNIDPVLSSGASQVSISYGRLKASANHSEADWLSLDYFFKLHKNKLFLTFCVGTLELLLK